MEFEKGSFIWAVAQMKQGKKVRRPGYSEGVYYYMEIKCNSTEIRMVDERGIESLGSISLGEGFATDWEIVEEEIVEEHKTLSDKFYHNVDIVGSDIISKRTSCVEEDSVKDFIKTIKKRIKILQEKYVLEDIKFHQGINECRIIIDEEAGEELK